MNNAKKRKPIERERLQILQENLRYQGNIIPRMVTIKDRNGMDLTETGEIKKRWQEYTEEPYKKIFMTQITTMVWLLT